MKKSTRKIINSLRKYIGHEIIRTRKTVTGYWGYTDQPILLVGFTSDGLIRYRHLGKDARNNFGDGEFTLPLYYTDRNWITYKKALKAKHNELNKWRGKKIKRIRPTSTYKDYSYMYRGNSNKAPTLISASKYHMVIRHNDDGLLKGRTTVLPSYFMNPEDWVLAE